MWHLTLIGYSLDTNLTISIFLEQTCSRLKNHEYIIYIISVSAVSCHFIGLRKTFLKYKNKLILSNNEIRVLFSDNTAEYSIIFYNSCRKRKKKLGGLVPSLKGLPDNIQTVALYIQTSCMGRAHANPQAKIPSDQMLQLTGTDWAQN